MFNVCGRPNIDIPPPSNDVLKAYLEGNEASMQGYLDNQLEVDRLALAVNYVVVDLDAVESHMGVTVDHSCINTTFLLSEL